MSKALSLASKYISTEGKVDGNMMPTSLVKAGSCFLVGRLTISSSSTTEKRIKKDAHSVQVISHD